jgi:chromosome segregation ATPase
MDLLNTFLLVGSLVLSSTILRYVRNRTQHILERQVRLMSQVDDLLAAVAADQAATDSAAALINTLQDDVTALTQAVADLQAQIDAGGAVDLTAITAQIAAMGDELTAAEAPNTPVEEPPVV